MQPYFLPYIGHFQLIQATDKWIVFDSAQYIRHGWINRNRILKPSNDSWQYVHVSLKKHSRNTSIKDILIKDDEIWKRRLIAQLEHYKKKAPFYKQVIALLHESFAYQTERISDLNVNLLKRICSYLEIDFSYEIYSNMNLSHEKAIKPGDWALNISKALGATSYINPIGGVELFDIKEFKRARIDLKFLKPNLKKKKNFHPDLSILDVMMFLDVAEIKSKLLEFELI